MKRKGIKKYHNLYEIDENGVVYSIERLVRCTNGEFRKKKATIKKPTIDKDGYLRYGFYIGDGKTYKESAHRLIYTTFVGEIPKDKEINHVDGNKLNNKLSNLEVCTHQENIIHSWKLGLKKKQLGEDASNAKLCSKDVLEVRRIGKNMRQKDIAKLFKISQGMVSNILLGKSWSHLALINQ